MAKAWFSIESDHPVIVLSASTVKEQGKSIHRITLQCANFDGTKDFLGWSGVALASNIVKATTSRLREIVETASYLSLSAPERVLLADKIRCYSNHRGTDWNLDIPASFSVDLPWLKARVLDCLNDATAGVGRYDVNARILIYQLELCA